MPHEYDPTITEPEHVREGDRVTIEHPAGVGDIRGIAYRDVQGFMVVAGYRLTDVRIIIVETPVDDDQEV